MYFILISIVFFTLTKCQNRIEEDKSWCSYIKPNDIYSGLSIRNKYTKTNKSEFVFVMDNKVDFEWVFNISLLSKNETPVPQLEFGFDTISPLLNPKVIYRFGIYGPLNKDEKNPWKWGSINCKVTPMGFNKYETFCERGVGGPLTKDEKTTYPLNFVVIKGIRGPNEYNYMFFFDRNNKSNFFRYDALKLFASVKLKGDKYREDCSKDGVECNIPKFIGLMNDTLFSKIEGVVDFSFGDHTKSGYLILFTIDGQPKYCLTLNSEDISDECKSSENMRNIFPECFGQIVTEPLTNSKVFWIIIVIIAIIAIVVLTIIISCCNRKNREVSSGETLNTSAFTSDGMSNASTVGPKQTRSHLTTTRGKGKPKKLFDENSFSLTAGTSMTTRSLSTTTRGKGKHKNVVDQKSSSPKAGSPKTAKPGLKPKSPKK